MSFSLYRRLGGLAFLDDDRDYLEMLGEVLPAEWYMRLFLHPAACIDMLQRDTTRREADAWTQQEIVMRWREGASLITQILDYWHNDGTARFTLTQVAVVDYAMPAMNGLEVLDELARWPGSRILLTGRADEQLAIKAFNRGLINQFVHKQSPDIRLRLTSAVHNLRDHPDQRHQQIWRATLSHSQYALLCEPLIEHALENLASRLEWIEHVVIGAPFGVLGLDASGRVIWVQLEPAANLHELADMALSTGWDASTVQDIRNGKKLIDLELQRALGAGHPARLREAFSLAAGSPNAPLLYAALFSVDNSFVPGFSDSYKNLLASQGERLLHSE